MLTNERDKAQAEEEEEKRHRGIFLLLHLMEKNIDADKVLEQIVFFLDVSAVNNVERDKCLAKVMQQRRSK